MSRPVRALVVDDEPLARRVLARLIAERDDVELVGCAEDGLDALATVAAGEIDLLLSDIVMPRLAGLELVERLPNPHLPAVIFVTAHAEHAVRAFELGAADYLLKPVAPERFALAISRARDLIRDRRAAPDLTQLLRSFAVQPTDAPTHIWAHVAGGRERVAVDQIEIIRAEGDYVRLVTGRSSRLADGPLERLSTTLAGAGFLRVHRSALIRLDAVATVRSDASRRLILVMRSGETVVAGRRSTTELRSRLLG